MHWGRPRGHDNNGCNSSKKAAAYEATGKFRNVRLECTLASRFFIVVVVVYLAMYDNELGLPKIDAC